MHRLGRPAILGLIIGLLIAALGAGQVFAYSTASGFAASDFATGFPNNGVGPVGLAFDSSNNLFVMDQPAGNLYKFSSAGGIASSATQVNTSQIPGGPTGIAFDQNGNLYAALQGYGDVVQLDETNGHIIRVMAGGITGATGLATDPVSGDLFVTQPCCTPGIRRISNITGPGPVTVTPYASTLGNIDGITFGPDGTIYAARYGQGVWKITGTNASLPGQVTSVANVSYADGIAVAANPDNPSQPPFLFVNRNDGIITKIDLTQSPPALSNIFTSGGRGDFAAVGLDGCFYATQTASVVKVTNADGTCSLAPTTPRRQTTLSYTGPTSQDYNDVVTVSAKLVDGSVNPNVPITSADVTFTLNGSETCTAATDSSGTATCSITPSEPAGTYTLTASYAGSKKYLSSQTSTDFKVTLEETALAITSSNTLSNGSVNVEANLTEDGTTPIVGRTVTFSTGSATGTGTTDSNGNATATLALPPGQYTLNASFAGDGYYQLSDASAQTLYVYQPSQFVIWGGNDADLSKAIVAGQDYYFWGGQWAKQVTGGSYQANNSFKGYADQVSGNTWTSHPVTQATRPVAWRVTSA